MKKSNLSWIRLIATLMIVSCHILQGLDLEAAFWINVGVQVFFVLSGYLYSTKKLSNTFEFYKKQYKKIIIPYWIVFIIIILLVGISKINVRFNIFSIIGMIIGLQYWTGTINILSHTWFISYILICYLITPILKKIKIFNDIKTNQTFLTFIILTVLLQLFNSYRIININVSYTMLYIFGYIIGHIEERRINKRIFVVVIILTVLLLPLRLSVQYFNNYNFIKWLNYFNVGKDNFISYHHALIGMSLFMIFMILFKKTKYNKILYYSDMLSYYVYLVHQIFILFDFSLLSITNNILINIVMIIIITIVSASILYILTKLINKFMHYSINYIKKLFKCISKKTIKSTKEK